MGKRSFKRSEASSSEDDLDLCLGLEPFDFLGGWRGSMRTGVGRRRGWRINGALWGALRRLVRRD